MNAKLKIVIVLVIVGVLIAFFVVNTNKKPTSSPSTPVVATNPANTANKNLLVCQGTTCVYTDTLAIVPGTQCYQTDSSTALTFCGSFIVGHAK